MSSVAPAGGSLGSDPMAVGSLGAARALRVARIDRPALLLALALLVLAAGHALAAGPVLAADPTATPAPGGDPRSSGEGPGFVGEPLLAIGLVLGIAVLTVVATLAWARATDRHDPRTAARRRE